MLIGDKDYLSQQYQQDLFESSNIKFQTPMRNNNANFKLFPKPLSKARKRIETLFSQLCDQFMSRRNYAKLFDGFSTRILSKITALTIS
jgi:predicted ATPase